MSENFDDLLNPSFASINKNQGDPSPLLIPNSSKTLSHSPPRPLTYAFDVPLKNPFADLPSTSNTTESNDYRRSFNYSNEEEHLSNLSQHPADPLSFPFENLSLSADPLTNDSNTSKSPPLSPISRSHAPITPIDNSAILFLTAKPPPRFFMGEAVSLEPQDVDGSSEFHDPLVNPPSQSHPSPTFQPSASIVSASDLPLHRELSESLSHPQITEQSNELIVSDHAMPTTFFVSVTNPIKVRDAINPYVVYRVTSKKTTDSQPQEFVVSRRYTEFLWLFHQLVNTYPGMIVPSLPEKHAVGRFQDDFIEHRRIGLNHFLVKIASHPILKNDSQFTMFLQCETITYSSVENSQNLTSKIKVNEIDKYFESKLQETVVYEGLLKALHKSFDTVILKHKELSKLHAEYGELLHMFAEVEEPHPLAQRIQHLGDVHQQMKKSHDEIASVELFNYSIAIEEQLRIFHSTKIAFQTRAAKLLFLQNLESFMQKKRASLSRSNISQPFVLLELDKLSVAVQEASKSFENASSLLERELERVKKERYNELSRAIQTLVESMTYKQQMLVHFWEDFYKILTTHR